MVRSRKREGSCVVGLVPFKVSVFKLWKGADHPDARDNDEKHATNMYLKRMDGTYGETTVGEKRHTPPQHEFQLARK